MRLSMKVTSALTALSLYLTAPYLLAEDSERWYQVEVLIFENPAYRAESPEQWPTYPTLERRSRYVTIETETLEESESGDVENPMPVEPVIPAETGALPDAKVLPQAFVPLDEIEHQLTEQRKRLENTRGFRTLYHQAWIQPVPGREQVVPIRIQAGDMYGQNRELQGYLDLYVERYLHLTADLQLVRYTQTDNPFRLIDERADVTTPIAERLDSFSGLTLAGEPEQTENAFISQTNNRYYVATQSIRLNEKRRMRSQELHYLDNPEFGLLFVVSPIKLSGES